VAPPTIQISKNPDCNLPELPLPLHPVVGFPDSEHIFITKTDLAEITAYLVALRQWIEAARGCLETGAH
jgi:hypothetical protein